MLALDRLDPASQISRDQLSIEEVIGTGSHGKVYKGTYQHTTVRNLYFPRFFCDVSVTFWLTWWWQVALKQFSRTKDGKEISRESRLHSGLHHPNIVQYLGLCTSATEDDVYIVLEYVPDGTLLDMLRAKGKSVCLYCIFSLFYVKKLKIYRASSMS